MGFLTSLFGGDNAVGTAVMALGVILILIVLGVWALKAAFKTSGNLARGRNRRISILDSVPLDQRRQLVLIRRDDVEHLILTGGGQDMVIESGIPVKAQPAQAPRPVPGRRPQAATKPQTAAASVQAPPQPAPPARPAAQPQRAMPRAVQPVTRQIPAAMPQPANSPAPAAPAAPAAVPPGPAAANRSPLERLRDLGRPGQDRKSASLRHTGLLRAVSRLEPVIAPVDRNEPAAAEDSQTYETYDETGWEDGQPNPGRDRDGK